MLSAPPTQRSSADQAGFSLVELLVVVFLLGIVGSIITVSVVRGIRVDEEVRARIDAFEDMQIAVERMSREIRAADPLQTRQPDRIQADVRRDGACRRFTYWVDGGALWSSEEGWPSGCPADPTPPTGGQILVPNVAASDVFTYETATGAPAPPGGVEVVRITVQRELLRQPSVTVSTVVGLRNP